MKKILLAIVMTMMFGFAASAQSDCFFKTDNKIYREISDGTSDPLLSMPVYHGSEANEEIPLGSGLLVLTALGAGYNFYRKKHS